MAKGFKKGATSGLPLNFKVMVSESEPSSVKDNMIWVISGEEMTSWILSHTEPEKPEKGMVWIPLTTSAMSNVNFNALKKNGIMVRPFGAFQYDGSQWVEKTMKIYQSGFWGDLWSGIIFDNGTYYNDIPYRDFTFGAAGYIYNDRTSICIGKGDGEGPNGARRVFGPIDLTGFKTVTVRGYSQWNMEISAYIATGQSIDISGAIEKRNKWVNGASAELTLNIPDLPDKTNMYVAVRMYRDETIGGYGNFTYLKLNR